MVRVYFLPGVIGPEGVDRGDLTTGWGMYNNIGCIIAMCIPASFYFASVKAKGWRFTLLGCVTLGALCSRRAAPPSCSAGSCSPPASCG